MIRIHFSSKIDSNNYFFALYALCVCRYLESHSEEAGLMESLLLTFRASMAAERGCSPEDIEEEELVDMLEQGIEEEEEEEAMDQVR